MFDFGFSYTELFVVAVVAILVIGPKDFPRVLRTFGGMVRKMRQMAGEFQGQLDSAMKEAGVDDIKKEFQNLKDIGNTDSVKKPAVSAADTRKAEEDFKKYFGEPEAAAPEAKSPA